MIGEPKAVDIHTAPVLDAEAAVLGGKVLFFEGERCTGWEYIR